MNCGPQFAIRCVPSAAAEQMKIPGCVFEDVWLELSPVERAVYDRHHASFVKRILTLKNAKAKDAKDALISIQK